MQDKTLEYREFFKNMSSFYSEYMIDRGLLETIVTSTMHSVDMLVGYTKAITANLHLQTAETTRQFPYIGFDISQSMYTLTRIVRTPDIHFLLGIPSGMTEPELIEYWRYTAPTSVKIKILDMMGIYTELVSGDYSRRITDGNSPDIYQADVVDADVFYEKVKKVPNQHYAIKDNKFYILDMYEFNTDNPNIVFKNITLDYDMCWKRTGSYVGVRYSDVVSRVEYNNLNKTFARMASYGPVLKDMKASISQMFNEEVIGMYDAFSRNNEKFYFWEAAATPPMPDGSEEIQNPTEDMVRKGKPLSVFDFVVTMPKDYAHPGIEEKDTKVEMFRRYLNVVKPVYAYYYISWMEFIGQDGTGRETIHPVDETYQIVDSASDTTDSFECQESFYPPCIEETKNTMSSDWADVPDYSSGMFFDDSLLIADDDYHMIEITEEPKFIEHVSLCLNKFPEAPVGVVANFDKGVVSVSFQNSGIGATYYEVYRNNTKIARVPITSEDRELRLSVSDRNFSNIKTDTYKVRTVYLKEGYEEGLEEYSHFCIVSVRP